MVTPEGPRCNLTLIYQISGTSVNAMVLDGTAPYHFFVDYADNAGSAVPAVDITPLGTSYVDCTWDQGIPGQSYKMFVIDANVTTIMTSEVIAIIM